MRLDPKQFVIEFDDLSEAPSTMRVTSPSGETQSAQIKVRDTPLAYCQLVSTDSLLADLVDLGIAVFVADRLSGQSHKQVRRALHLHLPLRQPEIFEDLKVYNLLCDTLHYFSHDDWSFTFTHRKERGRCGELQVAMRLQAGSAEVALWSGGLDSLAGLYNRIHSSSASIYTLFGTTSNRMIQGVQSRTARKVRTKFPQIEINFEQVNFALANIDDLHLNKVPRTRGFLFQLLGAVSAYIAGEKTLFIYENGIGAINLPFIKSSTGLDHTRAVHPVSLCRMSCFVSTILNTSFRFYNPFLFNTKAQLCELLVNSGAFPLIKSTITCDRRRRDKHIQCGRCSSCLLRRQALLVNGFNETNYAILSERERGIPVQAKDGSYLRAMMYQVKTMEKCLATADPWNSLAVEYVDLPSVVWWLADMNQQDPATIEQQLVALYRQYVSEWQDPQLQEELSAGLLFEQEMAEQA